MTAVTVRPFADAVVAYAQAGWPCILPVPARDKFPPPVGFTGAEGRDTDPLQLVEWAGSHAASSIALRMPESVIGIDVDAYVKGAVTKHGDVTFAEHLQRWGPLPPTWTSTARDPAGPSRIYFYRVPPQRYATKLAGAATGDVEVIQRHHRYAVVWPSPHPGAGPDAVYRWFDPSGAVSDQPPKPDELPELPAAWVEGLAAGSTEAGPASADRQSGEVLLDQLLDDSRPECADITSARLQAVDELGRADAGSRHDTMTARIHHLVQLAAHGHTGVAHAVLELRQLWDGLTAGENRAEELERMLLTSARKAVTVVGSHQVPRDPCLMTQGAMVPSPAPGDDRADAGGDPGADETPSGASDGIEPARWWSVREVIGTQAFDPRADLDQALAERVLERVYPTLRYAYDSHSWLLRVPERWESHTKLAPWAVAQVAGLMPVGSPEAEKGSDEHARSKRRARMMSNAGARAVAGVMEALVSGGMHPAAVRLGDLDSDPEVLWAGGVPWSLRESHERPTAAGIDPATPHLHAAGVVPERVPTPLWDAFLAAVWPDPEVRGWALRVLSTALTGYSDRALPILLGETGRGKTQVVALLMSVLGSYAHAANPKLLNAGTNEHDTIVYALKGRRLSFIDEAPGEARAGQERLKQLTGGGELTARQMNQDPITFKPTHTLVLTANDEPLLTDPAVRSRARLIPCDGDPEEVRRTRALIGAARSAAWRAEAPGVLAALMAEAAAWLAEPTSAHVTAAPERLRYLAEHIGAEQDPVMVWLSEETEPWADGTPSRELYQAFTASCLRNNLRRDQIPSETRWGRSMTRLGYPSVHTEHGKRRFLRVRPAGGAAFLPGMPGLGQSAFDGSTGGSLTGSDGLLTGLEANPSGAKPQVNPSESVNPDGSDGLNLFPYTCARAPAHAHLRRPEEPVNPSADPSIDLPETASDLQKQAPDGLKSKRERSAQATQRAAEKREVARRAAVEAAAGASVELPAVVVRDGRVLPLSTSDADALLATITDPDGSELTVDVENTGYPLGHADYALRTVQLGGEQLAVVLDPHDADQADVVRRHLAAAAVLHAHSATADLIPLTDAGLLDLEDAWARMHDTVVIAKLADPASTGSDPGLKQLSKAVLRDAAVSPAADEARARLFKAGKWLTDTKVTTPVDRSGWAQVDSHSETMVRYAASDVLDDAAIARRLTPPAPAVLDRERAAQRMTARVAHRGLRIDGDHVDRLLVQHTNDRATHAEHVRAFGIDNPGSDQQVGARLLELGAQLPRTKTGRPSVAEAVLQPFRDAPGQVGELASAVLDYRHHDTAIGTFLEPYQQLVRRGDGRARPTVYTLGADTGRMSCVQSDALIDMPRDLAKHPGGVPITEVKAGDWVYAFDHHRELVLKRVRWCAQTAVRQTVVITAENSAGHQITLRATPDHLIRLRSGDWRAAGNLLHAPGRPRREDGPRLMTMVKRIADEGYVKFFPHSIARKGAGTTGGGKNREHRWILEQITGRKISTKVDVNHIDGNRANNHPSNLQELPMQEHRGNRDFAWGVEQAELNFAAGPNDYRAVSVEPGLVEPVWDMEVDDVHNFIANGICVHNCVRPNLQQVPREGGFRACITADPGHLLVSADFAGVELRVAAALSQDTSLRAILDDPQRDLHWEIARIAFGPDATKANRYAVKRGVFGRIYGGGVGAVARGVGVSEATARQIIDAMDQLTPGLTEWSRQVRTAVESGHGQFPTYAGRIVHLPKAAPHAAPNYCIQGTARELLVDALLRWADTPWGGAVLLPVHDELVVMVPEDQAADATAALEAAMTTDLFGVPIKAEASTPAYAWADSA